jgi:hypothetical protein
MVDVNIILEKMCYCPGEILKGFIEIKPKTYLNDSILGGALTIIKFNQKQQYSYTTGSDDNETTTYVTDDKDIYKQYIDYRYFLGANILLGIKIPFQIKIPLDIQPTLRVNSYYISHHIYVEIPWIRTNKSLYIIIKDHHFFTLQNKLLKIPTKYMRDFYSDNNLSNGKITIGIILPKNSFTFYEPIPFQLIINNQGYKTAIENITLSISKFVYLNNNNNRDKHFSTNSTKVLIKKVLNPSGDLRNYKFEDNIQIPQDGEIKDLCPKKIYQEADNTKTLNFGCLTPFCIGGLISVEFFFKTEIKFKSGAIEFFEFPIELLSEDVNGVN